jgi:hypothetical protein
LAPLLLGRTNTCAPATVHRWRPSADRPRHGVGPDSSVERDPGRRSLLEHAHEVVDVEGVGRGEPLDDVDEAEAVPRQGGLVGRPEQVGRQAAVVQQSPEGVAALRVVVAAIGGARSDRRAAQHEVHTGLPDVGQHPHAAGRTQRAVA